MKRKLLKLSTLSFSLFSALCAYEIEIDKTLKVEKKETKSAYTYPALIRDNNKQIVTDPATNLMWQDNSAAKNTKRDWSGAKRYCQELSLGGYTDWRLPSIKELESIADYSRYPNAYKKGFKNFTSSDYWSATPLASDSEYAWGVYFKYGYSSYGNKTHKGYVRCARN